MHIIAKYYEQRKFFHDRIFPLAAAKQLIQFLTIQTKNIFSLHIHHQEGIVHTHTYIMVVPLDEHVFHMNLICIPIGPGVLLGDSWISPVDYVVSSQY